MVPIRSRPLSNPDVGTGNTFTMVWHAFIESFSSHSPSAALSRLRHPLHRGPVKQTNARSVAIPNIRKKMISRMHRNATNGISTCNAQARNFAVQRKIGFLYFQRDEGYLRLSSFLRLRHLKQSNDTLRFLSILLHCDRIQRKRMKLTGCRIW